MKKFLTEVRAVDPIDGHLKIWAGANVEAESEEEAMEALDRMGMGYAKIIGVEVKPRRVTSTLDPELYKTGLN